MAIELTQSKRWPPLIRYFNGSGRQQILMDEIESLQFLYTSRVTEHSFWMYIKNDQFFFLSPRCSAALNFISSFTQQFH